MTGYDDLLARRAAVAPLRGLAEVPMLHPGMFPYQRDVTDYLLRVGSGAAFLDTGLGKSLVALDWGRVVAEQTGRPVLMLSNHPPFPTTNPRNLVMNHAIIFGLAVVAFVILVISYAGAVALPRPRRCRGHCGIDPKCWQLRPARAHGWAA